MRVPLPPLCFLGTLCFMQHGATRRGVSTAIPRSSNGPPFDDWDAMRRGNDSSLTLRGVFRAAPVENVTFFERPLPSPVPAPWPHETGGPAPPQAPPPSPDQSYEKFTDRLISGAAEIFKSFLTPEQIRQLRAGFPVPMSSLTPALAGDAQPEEAPVTVHYVKWNKVHKFFTGYRDMPRAVLEALHDPYVGQALVSKGHSRMGAVLYTREDQGETIIVVSVIAEPADADAVIAAFKAQPPKFAKRMVIGARHQ